MHFLSILSAAMLTLPFRAAAADEEGFPAQSADTLEVSVVSADRSIIVSRIDTLAVRRPDAGGGVAQLLQGISGLQINDYGGNAGLKNIAIRGMGSTHTAIMVDGVRVNNLQSGQVDLGMLGLDGLESITIDYVKSTVNFKTAKPVFKDGHRIGGRVAMAGGSFGTYLPSARLDWKISEIVSSSIEAAGEFSMGNFKLQDGTRRTNNDLKQFRGGINLFGDLADRSGDWRLKAWCSAAWRGCPGSLSWASEDRQRDINSYVQTSFRRNVNDWYNVRASAKASYDVMNYISGTYNNYYHQSEIYAGSTHDFAVARWCTLSAAASLKWGLLDSDIYHASRLGAEAGASAYITLRKFRAEAAVNYTGTFDSGGKRWNRVSPAAALHWTPLPWLQLNASARRSFRTPTFNDLYYTGVGNTELRPEDAWMSEIGISFRHGTGIWKMHAAADGFYNHLTDKIISAPTDDPFIWTMYNLGTAEVAGVDAKAGFSCTPGAWEAGLEASYTFQGGTVIPYQPRHKGSATAFCSCKGWSLHATWNVRGSSEDSYGSRMPWWNTLDLTLSKQWKCLTFTLSGKNICNCRYEIASGYPMPGISAYGGVAVKF